MLKENTGQFGKNLKLKIKNTMGRRGGEDEKRGFSRRKGGCWRDSQGRNKKGEKTENVAGT